ncbi:Hypothetical predicted protein, partial [Olea europaea subsp. europaea]
VVCGHDVQDMSRKQPVFQTFLGSFLGQGVQAMSKPRQGCSLIFKHFWTISGHGVQAMSRSLPGRDRDTA